MKIIKKILIVLTLLAVMIMSTGCMVYGKGKISGYVTTVENGFFWDKVYIKSSLESSKEDCLIIDKNNKISDELSGLPLTRVNIVYDRHLVALTYDCYKDEIVSYTR